MWWFLIVVCFPVAGWSGSWLEEPLEASMQEGSLVLLQAFAEVKSPKKESNVNGKGKDHSSFLVGALQKPDRANRGFSLKQQAASSRASGKIGEAVHSAAKAVAPMPLARTVPLTEEGYQLIVDQNNNEQMKSFVRRVLAANGLGVNKSSEGALSGFVPFYSGQKATQSLQDMQRELQNAPWVVRIPAFIAEALMEGASGSSAPVSEAGYQLVVALRSDAEMAAFIRRVIEEKHGRLSVESEVETKRVVAELAPLYSGTAGPERSLAQLKRELMFVLPLEEGSAV